MFLVLKSGRSASLRPGEYAVTALGCCLELYSWAAGRFLEPCDPVNLTTLAQLKNRCPASFPQLPHQSLWGGLYPGM